MDRELSQMSIISLEVKKWVNRVKLYTNLYTIKKTNPIKSWLLVTSRGFKPLTS
jgi:hypothetical protein